MGRQAGAAARAVGQNFVAFVDQAFFVELVENPPFGFDIIVIEGDVRVIQIDEIAHALGQFAPLRFVGEDGFAAFLVELRDTVVFDFGLVVDAQLFFHFDFDRQAVGVPAGLTQHAVALHRLVLADGILQGSREDVVNPRLAVGRWRPFKEYKIAVVSVCFNRFV